MLFLKLPVLMRSCLNNSCTKKCSEKLVAVASDRRKELFLGQSKYETIVLTSSGACVVSCPDLLREERGCFYRRVWIEMVFQ